MAWGEMPRVWVIQGRLTGDSRTAVYQLINRYGLTVAGQRRARSSSQAASRSRTGPASGMIRPVQVEPPVAHVGELQAGELAAAQGLEGDQRC